jgi:hypothetical protein
MTLQRWDIAQCGSGYRDTARRGGRMPLPDASRQAAPSAGAEVWASPLLLPQDALPAVSAGAPLLARLRCLSRASRSSPSTVL